MLLSCGVGEDSWESLGLQKIQPVHPKGDQSWVFIGRTDIEAETPILWPPDVKSWLIWKDPDVGKDWGQEEKGTTEDEMAGWHHWLNGHGFGWTPGVGDGQGGLARCGSWGRKELDTTERLNWNWNSWVFFTLSYTNGKSTHLQIMKINLRHSNKYCNMYTQRAFTLNSCIMHQKWNTKASIFNLSLI